MNVCIERNEPATSNPLRNLTERYKVAQAYTMIDFILIQLSDYACVLVFPFYIRMSTSNNLYLTIIRSCEAFSVGL